MHFIVLSRDVADSKHLRAATLAAHRDYVDGWAESIAFSGPLVAADGSTRRGQFYLLEVADRESAERFVANDPFTKVEMFVSTEIEQVMTRFRGGQRANADPATQEA